MHVSLPTTSRRFLSCMLEGGGVMALDVVLRICSSWRLVPAIGTPLSLVLFPVQCAISALAQMMTHRASSISAKSASQLTPLQPAALSRCACRDSGAGDSATAIGPATGPAGRSQACRRSRAFRNLQGRATGPDRLTATDQFIWIAFIAISRANGCERLRVC